MRSESTDLPKFLCIGAQKSGTSWLHHILTQHPELSLPSPKETRFFENQKVFSQGCNWYLSKFDHGSHPKIRGEINPGYLWTAPPPKSSNYRYNAFRQGIPQRIAEVLGTNLKLIVMLRHPVRRAVSGYVHHLAKGRFELKDNKQDVFNLMGIAHIGFYSEHIKHWLKTYPKESFQFHCFERVRENKQMFYNGVLEFIGVPEFTVQPVDRKMQQFMEYELLADKTVRVIKSVHKNVNLKPGTILLDSQDITYLEKLYEEDISTLGSVIDDEPFW